MRSRCEGESVMTAVGCGRPAKPFVLERSQQKHTLSGLVCLYPATYHRRRSSRRSRVGFESCFRGSVA